MKKKLGDQELVWTLHDCKWCQNAKGAHVYQISRFSGSNHEKGQGPERQEEEETSHGEES